MKAKKFFMAVFAMMSLMMVPNQALASESGWNYEFWLDVEYPEDELMTAMQQQLSLDFMNVIEEYRNEKYDVHNFTFNFQGEKSQVTMEWDDYYVYLTVYSNNKYWTTMWWIQSDEDNKTVKDEMLYVVYGLYNSANQK